MREEKGEGDKERAEEKGERVAFIEERVCLAFIFALQRGFQGG